MTSKMGHAVHIKNVIDRNQKLQLYVFFSSSEHHRPRDELRHGRAGVDEREPDLQGERLPRTLRHVAQRRRRRHPIQRRER